MVLRQNEWFYGGSMELYSMMYLAVVWMLGGFVNGMTSLGGNLVGVPLSMLVMDAKTTVVFGCMTGMFVNGTIATVYHKGIPVRELILLCLSCVAGMPIGIGLLYIVPVSVLMLVTSCVLFAFLGWQFIVRRLKRTIVFPLWTAIPAGVVTGMLFGSTSIGGPVLALHAFMRGWSKETTLSTTNTIAAVVYLCSTLTQWKSGHCTAPMWEAFMWTAPAAVIGVLISVPLLRKVKPEGFRRLLLGMIAVSAVTLLYKGITG
jgi:hypothetical protein